MNLKISNVKQELNKIYREEQKRLDDIFKQELFIKYGVEDNSKAELAYRIAWEYGHSSGYEEVTAFFDDLVTLIKD